MFLKPSISVIKETEKEDEELAEILKKIYSLYRITTLKYRYFSDIVRNYNWRKFFKLKRDIAQNFMKRNLDLVADLQRILQDEKRVEKDEKSRKMVFSQETMDIDKARETIGKIKKLVSRESKLMQSLININYFQAEQESLKIHRSMNSFVMCVQKEIEFLQIENKQVSDVRKEIARLRERIRNHKKMPVVKSKYYHASPFVFNLGEKLKSYGARIGSPDLEKTEKIFEEVRKKDFPGRPSRMTAIYVDTDPRNIESYGIIYAVDVKGNIFETDQAIFTEACFEAQKNHDEKVVQRARDYWKGDERRKLAEPEIIVNGEVTIIGIADYIKEGDKIEIIEEGMEDDRGNLIPKGAKGKIVYYDKYEMNTPFEAEINGEKVALPPSVFKKAA